MVGPPDHRRPDTPADYHAHAGGQCGELHHLGLPTAWAGRRASLTLGMPMNKRRPGGARRQVVPTRAGPLCRMPGLSYSSPSFRGRVRPDDIIDINPCATGRRGHSPVCQEHPLLLPALDFYEKLLKNEKKNKQTNSNPWMTESGGPLLR